MKLSWFERLAAMIAVAILASAPVNAQERSLAGSEWRVQRIGEDQVSQESEMFVQFQADGKLSGSGGCNRFFGTYKIAGNRIEFGQIGATRMVCPEPVMKLETLLFEALAAATSFELLEIQMKISDGSETTLLELIQTDRD